MQDETKNKMSASVICGEIEYNDLSATEKNRITDALRRGGDAPRIRNLADGGRGDDGFGRQYLHFG